jgi:CHASE2 domain-containing sensor protein
MLPMINYILKELKAAFEKSWEWRIGYFLIGGFILARWLGLFSNLELIALDVFLRHRPAEEQDDHIVIVLIETDTIQREQNWDDRRIAQLLETILDADPAVVGLNVFRGQPTDLEARSQLAGLFDEHELLFGVEKVLPPKQIPPMSGMSGDVIQNQFGINDIPVDKDGKHRRVFIGTYVDDGNENPDDNELKFSFSFRVAQKYLESKGFTLENYPDDPEIPSFWNQETRQHIKIPILERTFGGYVRNPDIAPLQTLLNFRSGTNTFQIVDAVRILNGQFDTDTLRDKAVIIGSNDSFFPRFLPVSASSNLVEDDEENYPILPRIGIVGTELEAHSASQIISRVIADRPLIITIHPLQADLLIIFSGMLGIIASTITRSTSKSLFLLIFYFLFIVILCYVVLFRFGLWLPVLPMALALGLCGIIYLSYSYQNQKTALDEAKKLEVERRKAIERTFNFIHAGPLQTLAGLLRKVRDGHLERDSLLSDLEDLNKEIRGIGERLRQEAIENIYFIDTRKDLKIDLTHPIHEVFYEVYSICIQKDLPGFKKLKVRSVTFAALQPEKVTLDVKRKLCGFLQEAIENVGKHAIGTTRLVISGKVSEGYYCLRIDDNGPGIKSSHCGDGTKFCKRLEEAIKGKFSRISKPGGGTRCELIWPLYLN